MLALAKQQLLAGAPQPQQNPGPDSANQWGIKAPASWLSPQRELLSREARRRSCDRQASDSPQTPAFLWSREACGPSACSAGKWKQIALVPLPPGVTPLGGAASLRAARSAPPMFESLPDRRLCLWPAWKLRLRPWGRHLQADALRLSRLPWPSQRLVWGGRTASWWRTITDAPSTARRPAQPQPARTPPQGTRLATPTASFPRAADPRPVPRPKA